MPTPTLSVLLNAKSVLMLKCDWIFVCVMCVRKTSTSFHQHQLCWLSRLRKDQKRKEKYPRQENQIRLHTGTHGWPQLFWTAKPGSLIGNPEHQAALLQNSNHRKALCSHTLRGKCSAAPLWGLWDTNEINEGFSPDLVVWSPPIYPIYSTFLWCGMNNVLTMPLALLILTATKQLMCINR